MQLYRINPFDQVGLQEAVRLKEENIVQEVVVVSIGPKEKCQRVLRTALAMGGDRAVHVQLDEEDFKHLQPAYIANVYAKLATKEAASAIVMGMKTSNETAKLTAGLLGWEQRCTRSADGELLKTLPAVLSVDYNTLPNIINAKQNINAAVSA